MRSSAPRDSWPRRTKTGKDLVIRFRRQRLAREAIMAAKEISVKKYVVRLSGEERERLETLIRKGKSPARRVLKARSRCLGSWQRVERQPDHRSSGNQPIHGLPGAQTTGGRRLRGRVEPQAARDACRCSRSMTGIFEYEKGDRRAVPDFNVFFRYFATYPYYSDAVWYLTQMRRWGQITEAKPDAWYVETAAKVYRPDLYLQAARLLVNEGKAEAADFPWGSDGYRAPQVKFIDG